MAVEVPEGHVWGAPDHGQVRGGERQAGSGPLSLGGTQALSVLCFPRESRLLREAGSSWWVPEKVEPRILVPVMLLCTCSGQSVSLPCPLLLLCPGYVSAVPVPGAQ